MSGGAQGAAGNAPPAAPVTAPRRDDGTFAHKHSPLLRRLALQAGVDEATINDTPSEDLRLLVGNVSAERSSTSHAATLEAVADQTRAATANQPNAPVEAPPPAAGASATSGEEFTLDPEVFHPDHIRELTRVLAPLMREVKELRAQVAQHSQYVQGEMRNRQENVFDEFFKKYPDQFGKGSRLDLDPNGTERKLRRAFLISAESMVKAGLVDPKLPLTRQLEAARSLVTGQAATPAPTKKPKAPPAPPPPSAEEDETAQTINRLAAFSPEEWDNAGVAEPTHRTGANEPEGVSKAVQSVSRALRESNGAAIAEPTTLDEFPGG